MEELNETVVIEQPIWDVGKLMEAADFMRNFKAKDNDILQKLLAKYDAQAFVDLTEICHDAIEDFYDDRYPWVYNRKESLFDAFVITTKDGMWEIDHEPWMITAEHHQSNDIIFNNVFMEGWHGGSMGTDSRGVSAGGSPKYRTPVPSFTRWKKRPAFRAKESPFDVIVKRYDEYLIRKNKEFQVEYDNEINNLYDQLEAIILEARIK